MDGFLLVDKPEGWTSFDVVAKVRGIGRQLTGVKRYKVGHAGTLDPLATGLMIILLGKYTKRASEFSKLDKIYKVTANLGKTSTTGDEEGEKTEVSSKKPTHDEVNSVLSNFVGQQSQTPPQYSAVKINGKKAYELARQGKEVKIEPRIVTIHEITNVMYSYPKLSFSVSVSSGTYIRSLVEDMGNALGSGAYTSQLRRITTGKWDVKDAISTDQLNPESVQKNLRILD